MSPTKILLADDHPILVMSLRQLLADKPGVYEVVGEARNGRDVVELSRRLSPHVVLLDITMPDLNGLDAAREILRQNDRICLIFVTQRTELNIVRQAFAVGAKAYLTKDCEAEEVYRAIQLGLCGKRYVTPLLGLEEEETVELSGMVTESPELTPRQREILQLFGEGRTVDEIAQALHIQKETVRYYKALLGKHVGSPATAALVRLAIREGLVDV